MSASVEVYVTNYCPYCVRAKRLLDKKGATYTEIDVTHDLDKRKWLVTATGQHTVPQIFINGVSVGGSDELHDLERQGKLTAMLAASPAPHPEPRPGAR
ncbi:MAG: glutaredoxin 3 [Polyangiaceae bacterium]|nr:glutaredoxin 3 [Polyangiaceae bacterium]